LEHGYKFEDGSLDKEPKPCCSYQDRVEQEALVERGSSNSDKSCDQNMAVEPRLGSAKDTVLGIGLQERHTLVSLVALWAAAESHWV
jgi:hypothetical protein